MSWLYYVGGVLLAVLGIIGYVFYRGYNKIRPVPIKNIIHPPLSHAVLGHPDKMFHPLKHELRSDICESTRLPLYQVSSNHFL